MAADANSKSDLNEDEKQLFKIIAEGSSDGMKELLGKPGVRINCVDENGMTLLQHAAYKAKTDLCRTLLAHGADVNCNKHEHGYTTLMFAAISGSTEVTQLMLEAGAKISTENSVGRTAASMAAFVGQHQCVSLINNFFAKEDLAYYTRPNGLETEPKLPADLLTPLYNYILRGNLHPVGLSLYLRSTPELLTQSACVIRVLDLLCERMTKQSSTNHVLAIKFHYYGSLLRQCAKTGDKTLQSWIKSLLKGRPSDGFPETQESFIRSTLREFPYIDNQLLQQMIRTLAPVKIGDEPTSLSVLRSSINGQKFASEQDQECDTCGELNKTPSRCSACKMVSYCNQQCQKLHWFQHKKFCAQLAVQYKVMMERKRKQEEEEKRQKEEDERKQKEEEEAKKQNGVDEGKQKDDEEEAEKENRKDEKGKQAEEQENGKIDGRDEEIEMDEECSHENKQPMKTETSEETKELEAIGSGNILNTDQTAQVVDPSM